MRRLAALCLLSVAAVMAAAPAAEAQNRRRGPIVLNVQPRSFLDPGTVVPVGSVDPLMTGQGPTASYLNLPPWTNLRERFGEDRLPDPIVGPFLGARNPVGPVNFVAPDFLR